MMDELLTTGNNNHYNNCKEHTTTILWPFFRDHPGEQVPEKLLDFMVQGKIKQRQTHRPSGWASLHPN